MNDLSEMSADEEPNVSHGRGGVANIGHDSFPYVDGEIHREGEGVSKLTGRGGAGNVDEEKDPGKEYDVVPEPAKIEAHENEPYHSGRGGQGNVHGAGSSLAHEGLADKLKKKLFNLKK